MEPETMTALSDFGLLVAGVVMTFISSWILYLRKKDKELMEGMSVRLNTLENKYVTEQRVRELIREELLPISQETHEIKSTLGTILSTLQRILDTQAEERGFRRAMDALEKQGK